MKRFKTPENSHIGGWFLPHTVVDGLLDFWHNPDNQDAKVQGGYSSSISTIIDLDVKESTELKVTPHSTNSTLEAYEQCLQECLEDYVEQYESACQTEKFNIHERYNIQGYPRGGGYKALHHENGGGFSTVHRHLVFMTYLNDVENGGTCFPKQDIITPSIKGLTLIFPAYFTHPHVGQISKDHEKTIATGWYNFTDIYENIH